MLFIDIFSKAVRRNYLINVLNSKVYNNYTVESRSIRDIVTTWYSLPRFMNKFSKIYLGPQHSRTKGRARIFVTARTTRLSLSLNSPPHPTSDSWFVFSLQSAPAAVVMLLTYVSTVETVRPVTPLVTVLCICFVTSRTFCWINQTLWEGF